MCNLYVYKTEMSVRLSVCRSRFGGGAAEGDGGGGCTGRRGAMGKGVISMIKCRGGHTFPEQRRVTQLVINNADDAILCS